MINVLSHRQTPGTETSLVPGMIRIAFDLDQFSILDVSENTTAAMAAGTGGPGRCVHDLTIFLFHEAISSSLGSVHRGSG
jgi:hypothetical protein